MLLFSVSNCFSFSFSLSFSLLSVPPTVTTPLASLEVVIGGNITLTCSASGIHLPSITWSRGGESIAGSSREVITLSVVNDTFLTSEIEIANTEQRDTANYTCSANNSAGVASQTLFLQVLGTLNANITCNF